MTCEMHRCCCFNNSKDASFASGIYTTVISLICIISFAVLLNMSQGTDLSEYIFMITSIISLVVMILFFIFSVILLYGIIKTKRLALIPWMIWMIVLITLECIIVILMIIVLAISPSPYILICLFVHLPFIGLNITCFIAVKTYYQTLCAVPVSVDEESMKYSSLND